MNAVVLTITRNDNRLRDFRRHTHGLRLPWRITTHYGVDGSQHCGPPGWRDSAGAYGCYLSHLELLASCALSGDPLVVLEDDALFVPSFTHDWHRLLGLLPDGWDMLMLGGQHCRPPQPICEGLVRCLGTLRTHAYVVRPRAAELLRKAAQARPDHIDTIFAATMPMLRVYAPEKWLVGQRAAFSDVSGHCERERFFA